METEAERITRWEREMSEPSPPPWACRQHERHMLDDDEAPIEIVDADGDTVADNTRYYPHQIKVADAHFITLRVNAHDALVAALEECLHELDARGCSATFEPVKSGLAALALARGGK